MAGEIRPDRRDDVDAAGPSGDDASNPASALVAVVRQSAGQMPQDTPMALVYRLASPDDAAPR